MEVDDMDSPRADDHAVLGDWQDDWSEDGAPDLYDDGNFDEDHNSFHQSDSDRTASPFDEIEQESTVDIESVNQHHELPPALRHAYTTIMLAKVTGTADRATNRLLEHMHATIEIATEHTARQNDEEDADQTINDRLRTILGEDKKTLNWRTAATRLGVHPDPKIDRYICCPRCWSLTPLSRLRELQTPICGADAGGIECTEPIYDAIGHTRTPISVIPYYKLSTSLSLMLQSGEVVDNLQHWRSAPEDTENQATADVHDRHRPFYDPSELLSGYADGAAWRASTGNIRRYIEEDYEVVEDGEYIFRLTGLAYGLHIVIGMDW